MVMSPVFPPFVDTAGTGPLTLIQHLNWCLLTFLIAYLFESKEIAAYKGRKRLSGFWFCFCFFYVGFGFQNQHIF